MEINWALMYEIYCEEYIWKNDSNKGMMTFEEYKSSKNTKSTIDLSWLYKEE